MTSSMLRELTRLYETEAARAPSDAERQRVTAIAREVRFRAQAAAAVEIVGRLKTG